MTEEELKMSGKEVLELYDIMKELESIGI